MTEQIRAAQSQDKEKILAVIASYPFKWDRKIAKKYFDDYFDDDVILKGDKVFVMTRDGRIVGVSGYFLDRYETNNYWINWFYVHEDYQDKGYGTKLLEHLIDKLRQKGVKKLFIEMSSDKSYRKALVVYLDNGFRIEATIRDYYEKGEDQLILSRSIR